MRKYIKLLGLFMTGVVAAFLVAATNTSDVYALAANPADLTKLALLNDVDECYTSANINASVDRSSFTANKSGAVWTKGDEKTYVPTMVGNTVKSESIKCSQIFTGINSTLSGLASSTDPVTYGYEPDQAGNSAPEQAAKSQVTIGFGAVMDASSSAKASGGGKITCTGTKYFKKGGLLSSDSYYWNIDSCSGSIEYSYDGADPSGNKTTYKFALVGGSPIAQSVYSSNSEISWGVDSLNSSAYKIKTTKTGSLKEAVQNNIASKIQQDVQQTFSGVWTGGVKANPVVGVVSSSQIADGSSEYSKFRPANGDANIAADVAVYKIAGTDQRYLLATSFSTANGEYSGAAALWTSPYKYALYYNYLQNKMKEYSGRIKIGDCQEKRDSDWEHAFKNSANSWCNIILEGDAKNATGAKLNIVNEKTGHLTPGTFGDVLAWFENEANYSGLEDSDYANMSAPSGSSDDAESNGEDDPCYANAGALGWIMCPVIKTLDGVLGKFYDSVIENLLQVKAAGAFDTSSSTFSAWEIVRNIANVLFVILFLFVIFSQITGVGIDNYGIKRLLPKLVITAILVNMSFIVCQICIDISNIIGVSLRSMLENLAPSGTGTTISGLGQFAGYAFDAGVGAGLIVLIANVTAGGWWGIVLVALLAVLVLVIAIIFLLVVLIARQAALIILVILAPLAFICFLLPNTENIFKKWLEAMKGLLILYPICSLAVGGGAFAGSVLANVGTDSDNWIYIVAAMLIQVIPYFFIPSLVRGSMKAIGNLGEKIGAVGRGFGNFARGNTDRLVRNSNGFKNYVASNAADLASRNATRTRNRLMRGAAQRDANGRIMRDDNGNIIVDKDRAKERINGMSRRQRNRLAASQSLIAGGTDEVQSARALSAEGRLTESSLAAQAAAYSLADDLQEVKDQEALIANTKGADNGTNIQYLTDALRQELTAADGNVNRSRISALQNMLSRAGDNGRSGVRNAMLAAEASGGVSAAARQAYSQNIMSNWAADYKNNNRGVFDYAKQNTGATASGTLSQNVANAVNSLKHEQMANMDEAELQSYLARMNSQGGQISVGDGSNIQLSALSEGDRSTLQRIARETIENEQISQSLKPSQLQLLAQIADYENYNSNPDGYNYSTYVDSVRNGAGNGSMVLDVQDADGNTTHTVTMRVDHDSGNNNH